jgi:hypothetical protein
MELQGIFRATLDLTLSPNSGVIQSPRWKESTSIEFTAKHRYIENVITLPPSGNLTINVSSLGLTQVNFFYIASLEPNRSIKLRFNSDVNGIDLIPTDPSKKVYFAAVCNFSNLVIENLSPTDPVAIVYSLVEKV